MAHLEGGIKLLLTDCVSTLSPIQWHLDGRAAGFFVGVYHREMGTDGEHVDLPDRFAYACSETAPPTAKAIGDLVQEALEDAATYRWGYASRLSRRILVRKPLRAERRNLWPQIV